MTQRISCELPADFDANEYIRLNPELKSMKYLVRDPRAVARHYCEVGFHKGWRYKENQLPRATQYTNLINLLPNSRKQKKIVVYTSIVGGYDEVMSVSDVQSSADFLMFSDQPPEDDRGWCVRPMPPILSGLDLIRQQRCVKILPHLFLEPDYDMSVWVDGNIRPGKGLVEWLDKLDGDFHTMLHPHRTCVYDEGRVVVKMGKAQHQEVSLQMKHYKQMGLKKNAGLYQTGVIVRQHNTRRVVEICQEWWHQVLRWTVRDQLALPFALHKTSQNISTFSSSVLNTDLLRLYQHGTHKPVFLAENYGNCSHP